MNTKKKGRPPVENLYDKWVVGKEHLIVQACRNGADNEILAKVLGCGKTTLGKIIRENEDFKLLIRESKLIADLDVESELYKRAKGYDVEETETKAIVSKDGEGKTVSVVKRKKHIPGDVTAQIFWLKNRKPEAWRDNQNINISTNSFEDFLKTLPDNPDEK